MDSVNSDKKAVGTHNCIPDTLNAKLTGQRVRRAPGNSNL